MSDLLITKLEEGWIPPDRPYPKESHPGHAGRKGQRGGSAPSGTPKNSDSASESPNEKVVSIETVQNFLRGWQGTPENILSEWRDSKSQGITKEEYIDSFVSDAEEAWGTVRRIL